MLRADDDEGRPPQAAILAGLGYVRIDVSDHARPLDDVIERFVEAVRALPPERWVRFRCRAGRGRTTTFLVLYDMLRNARKVSLEDVPKRQERLAEDYDVLKPAPADSWKAPYVADRIARTPSRASSGSSGLPPLLPQVRLIGGGQLRSQGHAAVV